MQHWPDAGGEKGPHRAGGRPVGWSERFIIVGIRKQESVENRHCGASQIGTNVSQFMVVTGLYHTVLEEAKDEPRLLNTPVDRRNRRLRVLSVIITQNR
jgi:hypothetical protein